jgi:hypothetical protein
MDLKNIKNLKELNSINRERIFWLKLSALVVALAVLIIFNWDNVIQYKLTWFVFTGVIVISIIWWYWVMKTIRRLLGLKASELDTVINIQKELQKIKEKIDQGVD